MKLLSFVKNSIIVFSLPFLTLSLPYNNKFTALHKGSKAALRILIVNGFRSSSKPFYARIISREFNEDHKKDWFCSATIIDNYWALAAAHAIRNLRAESLALQVGDFHKELPTRSTWTSPVEKIIISKGFQLVNNRIPIEDLAMIKVRDPFSNDCVIRLCSDEEAKSSDILGSCGMGALSQKKSLRALPAVLLETYFMEAKYSGYNQGSFKPEQCPPSMICADGAFKGSNVCHLDAGGPLYVLECGIPRPKCLYGITSFSTSESNDNDTWCDGVSIFVDVLYFRYSIMRQIENGLKT